MGNGNFDDLIVRVPDWLRQASCNKMFIPIWVLFSVEVLSSRAFKLLVFISALIKGKAGQYVFLTITDMASFTNSNRQTTLDAVGDLLEMGAILRRRRGRYYEYTIRRV
jgi:hypothetical protein